MSKIAYADKQTASDPQNPSIPTEVVTAGDMNEIKESVNDLYDKTSYVALINQSSTDAPTLTVLKNDTGLTFTPSRTIAGAYAIGFSSPPVLAKLEVIIGNQSNNVDALITYYINSSQLFINTKDVSTDTQIDGIFLNTTLRINIYP